MTSKESVDNDLAEYFRQEENLSIEDRRAHLRAIYDKHFIFTKTTFIIKYLDILAIISMAKNALNRQNNPVSISGKRMENNHNVNIAFIEAAIDYISGHNLLKRIVKIDYKE